MKKLLLKPMSVVFLIFVVVIIGSNICCTGKASNNGTNSTANNDKSSTTNEAVIALTDQNFDAKISSGVTLVDFWATWCKPCRMQGPIIEEVGKEMIGKVTVGKVDIDDSPSIAGRFGVENIPTMIIFKNGKVVGQFVGLTTKEEIISALNNQLK